MGRRRENLDSRCNIENIEKEMMTFATYELRIKTHTKSEESVNRVRKRVYKDIDKDVLLEIIAQKGADSIKLIDEKYKSDKEVILKLLPFHYLLKKF